MPRLAPVSSITRRPWFDCGTRRLPCDGPGGRPALKSRVEARRGPAFARAGEDQPVMQAERPILPELDGDRCDTVAGPVGRAGHLADGVLRRVEGDRLLEGEAALERARLLARPGADAAVAGSALEVRVGLRLAHPRDGSPRPDLPAQALPVEDERRLRIGGELAPLGGLV